MSSALVQPGQEGGSSKENLFSGFAIGTDFYPSVT
jgi:hypothetical protein